MPAPGVDVILKPELAAIAYEYAMAADQRGFIAQQLLPIFEVPLQSAQYPFIPIEAMLKVRKTLRAPRSGYSRSDWQFEMKNYACQDRGLEEPLDDTERKLYMRFFDAEVVTVQRNINGMLMEKEARVAAMLCDAGNIHQNGDVSVAWTDLDNCDPRKDVMAARQVMRLGSGIRPNVLTVNEANFLNLIQCKKLNERLQYTQPIELQSMENQRRILAQYLGLNDVLVAGALEDTADKGQPHDLAEIWPADFALLAFVSSGTQDLREPCLGRSFLWTEDSPQELITEAYRDESKRSWIYRVRHNIGENFVFQGAAYLFTKVTTKT